MRLKHLKQNLIKVDFYGLNQFLDCMILDLLNPELRSLVHLNKNIIMAKDLHGIEGTLSGLGLVVIASPV